MNAGITSRPISAAWSWILCAKSMWKWLAGSRVMPLTPVFVSFIKLAARLRWYPRSSAVFKIRLRVSSPMPAALRMAIETAEIETFAAAATSCMVGRFMAELAGALLLRRRAGWEADLSKCLDIGHFFLHDHP